MIFPMFQSFVPTLTVVLLLLLSSLTTLLLPTFTQILRILSCPGREGCVCHQHSKLDSLIMGTHCFYRFVTELAHPHSTIWYQHINAKGYTHTVRSQARAAPEEWCVRGKKKKKKSQPQALKFKKTPGYLIWWSKSTAVSGLHRKLFLSLIC